MRSYIKTALVLLFGSCIFVAPLSAKADAYCPDCMLRSSGLMTRPLANQPGFEELIQRNSSILQFQQNPVTQPYQPQSQPFLANWSMGAGLPGSFQAPWDQPKAEYDPSFNVPAHQPMPGFWNNPQSPWIASGNGCPGLAPLYMTDPMIQSYCYPSVK